MNLAIEIIQFVLIVVIAYCILELISMLFTNNSFIQRKNVEKEVQQQSQQILPLSYETYSNIVNLINSIYDDIEAVNECNVLIQKCAEVAPNVDTDCETKSDKNIRFWRITYMTRIETKFLLFKDYWDQFRLSYPIQTRSEFDRKLSKISQFLNENRK